MTNVVALADRLTALGLDPWAASVAVQTMLDIAEAVNGTRYDPSNIPDDAATELITAHKRANSRKGP